MSNGFVDSDHLQDIADAIREKTGSEDTYKPSEMGDAIRSISTDIRTIAINVGVNGTYSPPSGKNGFSKVIVNVPGDIPYANTMSF